MHVPELGTLKQQHSKNNPNTNNNTKANISFLWDNKFLRGKTGNKQIRKPSSILKKMGRPMNYKMAKKRDKG